MICPSTSLRLQTKWTRRWSSRRWGCRTSPTRSGMRRPICSEIGDSPASLVTATMTTPQLKRPRISDTLQVLSDRFQTSVDRSSKRCRHRGENQRTSSTSLVLVVDRDLLSPARTRMSSMTKTLLPGTRHLNSTSLRKNRRSLVCMPSATTPGEASRASTASHPSMRTTASRIIGSEMPILTKS